MTHQTSADNFRDDDVKLGSAVLFEKDGDCGAGEVCDFDYQADMAKVQTTLGASVWVSRDALVRISHDAFEKHF